jgi:hypothetical protein
MVPKSLSLDREAWWILDEILSSQMTPHTTLQALLRALVMEGLDRLVGRLRRGELSSVLRRGWIVKRVREAQERSELLMNQARDLRIALEGSIVKEDKPLQRRLAVFARLLMNEPAPPEVKTEVEDILLRKHVVEHWADPAAIDVESPEERVRITEIEPDMDDGVTRLIMSQSAKPMDEEAAAIQYRLSNGRIGAKSR